MGELEPPKLLLLFDNKKGPYCKRGVNKFRCGVNEIDPISNRNGLILHCCMHQFCSQRTYRGTITPITAVLPILENKHENKYYTSTWENHHSRGGGRLTTDHARTVSTACAQRLGHHEPAVRRSTVPSAQRSAQVTLRCPGPQHHFRFQHSVDAESMLTDAESTSVHTRTPTGSAIPVTAMPVTAMPITAIPVTAIPVTAMPITERSRPPR